MLDEPELELAPPAPEPSPEQADAPEPAEGADVALPDSPPPELHTRNSKPVAMSKSRPPLPYPPRLQVDDRAVFCHNRRCVKHLSFVETTQPSVLEDAGTSGEATVLPTPGGEIDDALQVMRLPRDDLSHVRQMVKAIDKFALVNLD
jgi:hypothetical protein